jgi:hypothetical protein
MRTAAVCSPHPWKETGRCELVTPTCKGKPASYQVLYTWLQCPSCGQNGFRRDNSPVVYTWQS